MKVFTDIDTLSNAWTLLNEIGKLTMRIEVQDETN